MSKGDGIFRETFWWGCAPKGAIQRPSLTSTLQATFNGSGDLTRNVSADAQFSPRSTFNFTSSSIFCDDISTGVVYIASVDVLRVV